MGKASRDKGARGERQVVDLLRQYGIECQRTGEWKVDDIHAKIAGEQRTIEVKVRAKGASAGLLYDALENGVWAVSHKADYKDWLISMRLKDLLELIKQKL